MSGFQSRLPGLDPAPHLQGGWLCGSTLPHLNFTAKNPRCSELAQCPSCTPKYIKQKTAPHMFESSYTCQSPGPPLASWSRPKAMKDEGAST